MSWTSFFFIIFFFLLSRSFKHVLLSSMELWIVFFWEVWEVVKSPSSYPETIRWSSILTISSQTHPGTNHCYWIYSCTTRVGIPNTSYSFSCVYFRSVLPDSAFLQPIGEVWIGTDSADWYAELHLIGLYSFEQGQSGNPSSGRTALQGHFR